jgi:hypothetical protein
MGRNKLDFFRIAMPEKVQDRRDCPICGHQAVWHQLNLGLRIADRPLIICMLCMMGDPSKQLSVCWEGSRA